jgi:hypothetical protein
MAMILGFSRFLLLFHQQMQLLLKEASKICIQVWHELCKLPSETGLSKGIAANQIKE